MSITCLPLLLGVMALGTDAPDVAPLFGPATLSEAPPVPDWRWSETVEFELLPGVYLARLVGDVRFGTDASFFSLENDLDLQDLEASFVGELTMRKGDAWGLHVGYIDFETDNTGTYTGRATTFGDVPLVPGDDFDGSLDLRTANLELRYSLRPLGGRDRAGAERFAPDGRLRTSLRVAPFVGMRIIDVEMDVTTPRGSDSFDQTWAAPYAGLRVEMHQVTEGIVPFLNAIEIDVGAAAGPLLGGDGGFMAQIRGGVTFDFTPNVGFMIGYRLLHVNSDETDGVALEAGLQGLFLSGSIRF